MPEASEVGGGSLPAARDIARLPEARDSRETVINAFNASYTILEQAPDNKLTPKEQAARDLIKQVKEKTLDQGKLFFINRFKDVQGYEYRQREHIPVDDLIDFLSERIEGEALAGDEKREYQEHRATLIRNSQPHYRLPNRTETGRLNARVRQEYERVRNDTRLSTGNEQDDWFLASSLITKRRELILPRPRQVVSPPPESTQPGPTPQPEPVPRPPEPAPTPFERHIIPIPPRAPQRPAEPEPMPSPEPPAPAPELPPTSPLEPLPSEPPTPEPAPQPPEPELEPAPLPIEEIRREFVIANRTIDIRKRAAELAQVQLREEMRRGNALNPLNWPRKIGLRIMEQHYRQRFINRATEAMVANNNSYLDMDVVHNVVRDANADIAVQREAGKATVTRVKEGGLMYGEQLEEAQGELRDMMFNEIIRPAVEGNIANEAQVQQRLREFVQAHENDPQVQAIFGRDATQYGRLAEYFATDLLDTAETIRQDLAAHRYAITQLNEVVKIKLANTEWAAETQANFNAVDRAVSWAERHRVTGVLINPATIGAAFSLGTYGVMRLAGATGTAAQAAVPMAGLIPGAIFAGVRRNYDLKVDRAAHQVERTYSRDIPPTGTPRREALERFAYNTASVGELLNGGGQELLTGTDRVSMERLLRADLTVGTNCETVARRIAEIKTRLDFSARERVDLVTFAGREQVEQERLQLVRTVVEARRALGDAGMSQDEITALENQFTTQWNDRFTQNRQQQDREFAHYRLRNALGAAAFGGAVGLGSGLLVQEGLAQVGRHLPGAVNVPVVGSLLGKGQTALERGLTLLGIHVGEGASAASTLTAEVGQDLFQNPGNLHLNDELTLAVDFKTHAERVIYPGGVELPAGTPHPPWQDVRDDVRAVSFIDTKTGQPMSIETHPFFLRSDGALISYGEPQDFAKLDPRVQNFLANWQRNNLGASWENQWFNIKDDLKDMLTTPRTDSFIQWHHAMVELKSPGVPQEVLDRLDPNLVNTAGATLRMIDITLRPEEALGSSDRLTAHAVSFIGMDNNPHVIVSSLIPGNEHLTPAQLAEITGEMGKDAWQVNQYAPGTYDLMPSNATEYTPLPPSEAPPIIPIPMTPRHPLEPLVPPPGRPREEQPPPRERQPGEQPPIEEQPTRPLPLIPEQEARRRELTGKRERQEQLTEEEEEELRRLEAQAAAMAEYERRRPPPAETLETDVATAPEVKLLDEVNRTLAENPLQTAQVEITPGRLVDYLKTIPLPMGASINELTAQIINGQLATNGTINTRAGVAKFTARFVNNPRGGLSVLDHTLDLPLLARGFRGQIESQIISLNQLVTNQINRQIDPSWEVRNFQIAQDKLAFDFQKKQTQPVPVETTMSPEFVQSALAAGDSQPSDEHPDRNDDKPLANMEKGYLGVFDGMGGYTGGDVAASIAVNAIGKVLNQLPSNPTTTQTEEALRSGWQIAHEGIKERASRNLQLRNMGTVATVGQLVQENGRKTLVFAHAGDTRFYVLKSDGRLVQITQDEGAIPPDLARRIDNATGPQDIVGIEAAWNNRNAVTNFIDANSARPTLGRYEIQPDDILLLGTSDGVHDNLPHEKPGGLQEIVLRLASEKKTAREIGVELVAYAKGEARKSKDQNFRAKMDDITAVAMLLR